MMFWTSGGSLLDIFPYSCSDTLNHGLAFDPLTHALTAGVSWFYLTTGSALFCISAGGPWL